MVFSLEQRRNRMFVLISPILIILLGYLGTKLCYPYLKEWTWVVTAVLYWTLMGSMLFIFCTKEDVKGWLQKGKQSKPLFFLAVLIGIFPILGILLLNYDLLMEYPTYILYWILFACINPLFEEGYWRGLVFEAGKDFSKSVIIIYSTLLFVISHPMMWGVFSIANRSNQLYISLFVMGIVWSVIRLKTNSLRYSLFSHFLVDIGNMTVYVFLNLYIPPQM